MASEFHLRIMTDDHEFFDNTVSQVVLPAFDGQRGILASHEDFLGLLGIGTLKIVKEGVDHWLIIRGGAFAVEDGEVTVLAENAEVPEELDVQEARLKLKDLEDRLASLSSVTEEFEVAQGDLQELKACLEVHEQSLKHH